MDDDDEVINPDDLPRRILTDFAIYKDDGAACMRLHARSVGRPVLTVRPVPFPLLCTGFMATLELIPMWAGVDPDVELCAPAAAPVPCHAVMHSRLTC